MHLKINLAFLKNIKYNFYVEIISLVIIFMKKNKIISFIVFTSLLFVLSLCIASIAKAQSIDQTIPDNVKISTSPDGSSTTVVINSKPGFTTNVETSCVNGKCTHKATSKEITKQDIQKIQDDFKKQQEAMEQFWKMQEQLFQEQQKMFQDVWGVNWF